MVIAEDRLTGEERLARLEQTTASNAERLASLEGSYEHVATKADIERLERILIERMTGMETDVNRRMSELEISMMRRMTEMETRMTEMETRMTRWLVGTMIAGFALIVAALKLPPIG